MEFLQADIAAALDAARPKRVKGDFAVEAGGKSYPIIKLWRDGFEIAEDAAPTLRGFVDLLSHGDRIARCLIVCAEAEAGVVTYEFKRRTENASAAPADYARDDDAPVALLT